MFSRKSLFFQLTAFVVLTFSAFLFVRGELRHSDVNWTLALFEDLFISGGKLSSWNLSQHTDFFPDKVLSFFIWKLTPNYTWFFYLYGLSGLVIWMGLVQLLFKNWRVSLLSGIVPLAALSLGFAHQVLKYVWWPSLHFNAICVALICYFSLKEKCRLAFALKLMALFFLWPTLASDKLVAVYLLSLVFGEMYFDYLNGTLRKTFKGSLALVLFLMSAVILQDFVWAQFASITKAERLSLIDVLLRNVSKPYAVMMPILFVLFLVGAKKATRKFSSMGKNVFALMFMSLSVPTLLFPLFYVEPRYISFSFFIFLGLAFFYFSQKNNQFFNKAFSFLPLLALFSLPQFVKHKTIFLSIEDHPLSVCLKEVAKNHPLKEGIGTYWNTHEVNLYGNAKYPIRAVQPNLRPYHWVNSLEWFNNKEFNFIVLQDKDYRIPLENIKKIVPGELFVHRCREIERDVVLLNTEQESALSLFFSSLL